MNDLLLEYIINSIEINLLLLNYINAGSKYLHMESDYFGRNLRSLFNKDSW